MRLNGTSLQELVKDLKGSGVLCGSTIPKLPPPVPFSRTVEDAKIEGNSFVLSTSFQGLPEPHFQEVTLQADKCVPLRGEGDGPAVVFDTKGSGFWSFWKPQSLVGH